MGSSTSIFTPNPTPKVEALNPDSLYAEGHGSVRRDENFPSELLKRDKYREVMTKRVSKSVVEPYVNTLGMVAGYQRVSELCEMPVADLTKRLPIKTVGCHIIPYYMGKFDDTVSFANVILFQIDV